MVPSSSRSLASFAALLVAAASGYLTGIVVDRSAGASIVGISVLAGLGCLFGGVWQRDPNSQPTLVGPIACVALVAYVIAIVVMNPLEDVISEGDVACSIMLLAPLALGACLFFRVGRWVGAVGTLLVCYAVVVAVAFNVFHRSYGIGVFASRIE
jgi:hypothetical protein